MTELLQKMAELAHAHRLVPFLGAGCSLGHVSVDWNGITEAIRARLTGPLPDATNPEVAEAFVEQNGADALAKLLREHLLIDGFDDANGVTPLQILGLELRSVYTTNQDNVFEQAAARYGRPLVVVSTLADLASTKPGDRVLYKFHGDLQNPDTLVFTKSQYDARMNDAEHFLNVRLKSDLLAKNFLFIGYSFKDPNLQQLFSEMEARFPRALPGSYLIAYRWSAELASLCSAHGVACVNPCEHLAEVSGDHALELQEFLARLCDAALRFSIAEELESLFQPKTPPPERWVIGPQARAIVAAAQTQPAGDALAVFRGAVDGCSIPESLHTTIADALVTIVRKAPGTLAGAVHGALFNLDLPTAALWEPVAAYLALANRLPRKTGFSSHRPSGATWPDALTPLAAARAAELLEEWNEPLNDGFYSRSSQWFDEAWCAMPEAAKEYARPIMDRAWSQRHTTYEHPIKRAERIGASALGMQRPTFNHLHATLLAAFPKRFRTPYEK